MEFSTEMVANAVGAGTQRQPLLLEDLMVVPLKLMRDGGATSGVDWAAAAPTSGTFSAGDIVYNSAPALLGDQILLGWSRITTGSSNVMNVDWVTLYVKTQPIYLPEAQALFARMTTQPTDARKLLINTFIGALIDSGVWSKFDCLYVLAAADSQAAGLNWKQNAYDLTATSAPTFTADRGYQGNGTTNYLNTGFAPGNGQTLTNDNHIACWTLTNTTADMIDAGSQLLSVLPRSPTGNTLYFRSATTNSDAAVPGVATAVGFASASRTNSAGYLAYKDGSLVATRTAASVAFSGTSNLFICGRNNGGLVAPSTRQIALVSVGGSLDGTQETAYYNAAYAYLHAVGAV